MKILLNLYLSEKGEVYKKGKSTINAMKIRFRNEFLLITAIGFTISLAVTYSLVKLYILFFLGFLLMSNQLGNK
jgi:hypothetical protein